MDIPRGATKYNDLFCNCILPWWHHQMETFSALLALCAGNSPVTGEFPSQRPVTRSFDVLFDLRLNKCLNKQSRCLWFETPSRSLWRHCNTFDVIVCKANRMVALVRFESVGIWLMIWCFYNPCTSGTATKWPIFFTWYFQMHIF